MSAEQVPHLTPPVSERDRVRGPAGSPVTIVEFGDYECPYCGRAENSIREIEQRLGDQVRLAWRHFPNRTVHPHARLAAEAAEAAGSQGKFWEMHHLLFSHQDQLEQWDLIEYARQLELDLEQFERDLEQHTYADKVREDFRSGLESGVRGTPTFFINGLRYDGAWDPESLVEAARKPIAARIRELTQEFTRLAASGGLMLLIFTSLALLWANSGFSDGYLSLFEMELGFELGNFHLSEHLLEWINDGLMVIFFFVLGLEIKRELTAGELRNPKRAALPMAAALGGILVPAAIYVLFNLSRPEAVRGWGIPIATDIAFTLGILTVLGSRIPTSLKVFFTAMAIADDVGGILVIALFYSSAMDYTSLVFAALIVVALLVLNRWRVYSPLPYALLGIGLWFALLQSGVHPTLAGVLLAATIPTRSPANLDRLVAQADTVLNRYDYEAQEHREQAVVHGLKTVLDRMEPPAQRLEHAFQPWTTYLILPIFALANAGVILGADAGANLGHPVSLGIISGLVIGKPLGVSFFAWLATRLGWAEMPPEIGWKQFLSASFLAGIGFTISLFITQASFADPQLLSAAKVAILMASVLSAVLGFVLLNLTSPSYDEITAAVDAPQS